MFESEYLRQHHDTYKEMIIAFNQYLKAREFALADNELKEGMVKLDKLTEFYTNNSHGYMLKVVSDDVGDFREVDGSYAGCNGIHKNLQEAFNIIKERELEGK